MTEITKLDHGFVALYAGPADIDLRPIPLLENRVHFYSLQQLSFKQSEGETVERSKKLASVIIVGVFRLPQATRESSFMHQTMTKAEWFPRIRRLLLDHQASVDGPLTIRSPADR